MKCLHLENFRFIIVIQVIYCLILGCTYDNSKCDTGVIKIESLQIPCNNVKCSYYKNFMVVGIKLGVINMIW